MAYSPGKLNRSVLDSAIHPDWVWRETWRRQAVAARANVDALFAWLSERNSVYGLGTSQAEVYATSEALAAKLRAKPIPHPQSGTPADSAETVSQRPAQQENLTESVRQFLSEQQANNFF